MIALLGSLVLFIALHSIPAVPQIRSRLIGRCGRATYFTLYSVASTATLVLVFWTAYRLDYVPLWDAYAWQAWVTIVFAPVGLFLVIAGLVSANPFSVTLRRETGKTGAIVRVTRHPVPVGFALWAASHLIPNGDLRSVILFSIFALFSLGGIAMQEKRARRRMGTNFSSAIAGTSILPLRTLFSKSAIPVVDLPLVLSLLATAAMTAGLLGGWHELLIGVDPLALATAF